MAGAPEPPRSPMANLSMNDQKQNNWNEKQNNWQQQQQQPSTMPPPPAYGASSAPPLALAHATALYAYRGDDAGDLELQAGDKIAVTEYMNAEWWKGRSSRTGAEGIFPRSYVRVEEEKAPMQPQQPGMGYGNVPLETSGMGSGAGRVPGKGQEMGKKFGKKLGNAAIFGAGATIGADIVNSIL